MSAEERLSFVREAVDRALSMESDDLISELPTRESRVYAEGMRDGVRLALENVRELLES